MLKSCVYCGRVHDSRMICKEKQGAFIRNRKSQASAIRNSSRWQKTRDYIKARDHGVCQMCLRNHKGTGRPYEGAGLSVHHIAKIEDDAGRAFDEFNLITLCSIHHDMAEKGKIDQGLLWEIAKENTERYRGIKK